MSLEKLYEAFHNLFMQINDDYRQYRAWDRSAVFNYYFYPSCRWQALLDKPRRPFKGEETRNEAFLRQTQEEAVGIRKIVDAAGVDIAIINAILRFGHNPEKESLFLQPVEVLKDGQTYLGYTPTGDGEQAIMSSRLISAIRAAIQIKAVKSQV